MLTLPPLSQSTYLVLGLGKTGLASARWLLDQGARVLVWDDHEGRRIEAEDLELTLADPTTLDWATITALCLSPGIPHTWPKPHPAATAARAAAVPILGDIELLARAQAEAVFVGITGTNGKSTTTALIGHILQRAGQTVEIGGNLGTAALTLAPLGHGGTYVLELSSYQLELNHTLHLAAALLLNITPDHLDRHGGMPGYVAAKRRIFDNQKAGDAAIIGVDDAICREIADELSAAGKQRVIRISSHLPLKGGVYAHDGVLFDALDGDPRAVIELKAASSLPGAHNAQNAAAAYAACRVLGVPATTIAQAIQSFPGLPHRQERIATINGIQFINDSKATNADATRWALGCYEDIYWIAGGLAKTGGIEGLDAFYPRIRKAYLIGQCADEFAATLNGHVPVEQSGDLASAVASAAADATLAGRPAAVVLLSPAAASFDQYSGFEARGDHFRQLVREIATQTGGGVGK